MIEENAKSLLYNKILGCLLGGEIGDAMGAPAEGKTFQQIIEEFGSITDFNGFGTDDSALKHILCDAIDAAGGYPTADDWAEQWLDQEDMFLKKRLFWIPVMNGFWKIHAEGISPREAGCGNMASSSSAMCISPMGIINAGNPRQAALETYDVASTIHHNYCRDAACSMAAAVAAAMASDASIEGVLKASAAFLPPISARTIRSYITETLALAREAGSYETFREAYYEDYLIPGIAIPDSRETVPVALSLFYLAKGDPQQTIIYGANFGRDADTIASMAGALAGAYAGADAFPAEWITKVSEESPRNHEAVALRLVQVVQQRLADSDGRNEILRGMMG